MNSVKVFWLISFALGLGLLIYFPGGELARFILALKVVLAARGSAPTLIFDEADSGVGGATAAAVGERLSGLADSVQVLAVTHAPQVAALAAGHLMIAKETVAGPKGEAMATRVAVLEGEHRREEGRRGRHERGVGNDGMGYVEYPAGQPDGQKSAGNKA